MTFLPSFPGQARMSDVFKARWDKYGPIIHLAESLMRGPSELSEGERELIHAYSSALNACGLCTGAHTAVAEAFGVPRPVVEALVDDIDSAPIEDRMKPILRYVKKLALTPSATTPRDVAAILEAGWSAAAVQDAVLVCPTPT